MPAFGSVLTDEQIVAVLAHIKSTWPSDILRLQREVTPRRYHRDQPHAMTERNKAPC